MLEEMALVILGSLNIKEQTTAAFLERTYSTYYPGAAFFHVRDKAGLALGSVTPLELCFAQGTCYRFGRRL